MKEKQLNKLELNLTATEVENENVQLAVKVDAACTPSFLANAFARLMEQDKTIKEAMIYAVLNDVVDSMSDDVKEKLAKRADELLYNIKPTAQA